MLRNNYHYNKQLQEEWNEYGECNFQFCILYECVDGEGEETVDSLEQKYIRDLSNIGSVYNLCEGGKSPPTKGKHLSESQRKRFDSWTDDDRVSWGKKMSEFNRGYTWSAEQKQKLAGNKNGAKYTSEDVIGIREMRRNGMTYSAISKETGVPESTIYSIVTYKRWKELP